MIFLKAFAPISSSLKWICACAIRVINKTEKKKFEKTIIPKEKNRPFGSILPDRHFPTFFRRSKDLFFTAKSVDTGVWNWSDARYVRLHTPVSVLLAVKTVFCFSWKVGKMPIREYGTESTSVMKKWDLLWCNNRMISNKIIYMGLVCALEAVLTDGEFKEFA